MTCILKVLFVVVYFEIYAAERFYCYKAWFQNTQKGVKNESVKKVIFFIITIAC